jgi:hypothetical protein
MQVSRGLGGVAIAGVVACGDPVQSGGYELSTTDGSSPEEQCLTKPKTGSTALRYQCAGDMMIDVVVEGDFDESPVEDSLTITFGHGVPGDSYEEPHVMACCPAYDPDLPDCEQGHEQACMADLASQGCMSIEPNLRDFADDHYGGPGLKNAIIRSQINKIAEHVANHQGDCIDAFIENTGVGPTEPSCNPDGTGVEYDALLETGEWSFDPDGAVDLVTISIAMASWAGIYSDGSGPATCTSSEENDGVVFNEIDPASWAERLLLAAGTAVLDGPGLGAMGIADLESLATGCGQDRCSQLAIAVDHDVGTASLDDFQLRLAGTTVVRAGSISMPVDGFGVRLWDSTRAVLRGNTATIPPGGAWFVVSAASGAVRGVVSATNETAIVLREADGGWSSSAFTIAKRDAAGERWALVVMPARWE